MKLWKITSWTIKIFKKINSIKWQKMQIKKNIYKIKSNVFNFFLKTFIIGKNKNNIFKPSKSFK